MMEKSLKYDIKLNEFCVVTLLFFRLKSGTKLYLISNDIFSINRNLL